MLIWLRNGLYLVNILPTTLHDATTFNLYKRTLLPHDSSVKKSKSILILLLGLMFKIQAI